jgi:hypothetical protein
MPAAGIALLHSMGVQPALADANFDRYAASGYVYCDAVILGSYWGESVDEAKATIGRKIGWGNDEVLATDLQSAIDNGERCSFADIEFVYEDAEALAQLWGVSVDDAKAALADKVSTGYTELAQQVVAQAHAALAEAESETAGSSGSADLDRFFASAYAYCDAVVLGQHWNQSAEEAKTLVGRKLGWGDDVYVQAALRDARVQNRRCAFDDTGYSYEDATALARLWGVGVNDAKSALAEKVSMGQRRLADQVVAQANGG